MVNCERLWTQINRCKRLDTANREGPLRRCLGTADLTMIGLGQMVGPGIFVITGTVMKEMTGPAVMLAYIISGFGCFLAALCYAEFSAKVPLAGSAYSYTYVAVGELWAFAIGWSMLLEYMIGAAGTASALSGSVDSIFDNTISNFSIRYIGRMTGSGLAPTPNILASLIIIFVAVFVAVGVRVGTTFNNIINVLSIIGILCISVLAFTHADISLWTKAEGGFLPYGFKGVLSGAATCFFAYVGFDAVAASGEEALNPKKSLPVAITLSILGAILIYAIAATSISLIIPYKLVNVNAPFPLAFQYINMPAAKNVVAIVSILSMATTSYVCIYTVPRIIYAMATDGLLFGVLGSVNNRTQTPLLTIAIATFLSAILALLLNLDTLVELLSIGTLFAYTIVSACVMVLRYRPMTISELAQLSNDETIDDEVKAEDKPITKCETSAATRNEENHHGRLKSAVRNFPVLKECLPGRAVAISVITLTGLTAAVFALAWYGTRYLSSGQWWAILIMILLLSGVALCFFIFLAHVRNDSYDTFMVPLVPWLPAVSIMFNVMLMLKLRYETWIRAGVWLVLGFIIYFTYGIRHSGENRPLSTSSSTASYGSEADSTSLVTKHTQPILSDKTTE